MQEQQPPTDDRTHVLLADDQADVREALALMLEGEGYRHSSAASPAAVLAALEKRDFDLLLLDLNYARDTTSGREGLELLDRIRALDATLPVVVMTAYGSIEGAVEAMRRGARDYVEKPWDNTRLLATIRAQVELGRAVRSERRLVDASRRRRVAGLPDLVCASPAMQTVVDLIERVGPSDANVLLRGEHGTGKEVVARWLHHLSGRQERPLIPVNAGALPDGVFESELFGHVKGAFTDAQADRPGCFELADGGTLFLDEVANMPMHQQAKLLRVLQTGEFSRVGSSKVLRTNVRTVSATNAELADKVAGEAFREDLLYRLNTVEIVLPALRDRREDVLPLAASFLEREAQHYAKPITGFEDSAADALMRHRWPGNVRELEHTVERAVLLARGERITAEDLTLGAPVPGRERRSGDPYEGMTLDEVEQTLVERALERHDGNVSRAAESLGLSRSALYRRLQRHGDAATQE